MDSTDSAVTGGGRSWARRAVVVLVLVVGFLGVMTARSFVVGLQAKGQWAQTHELLEAHGTERFGDPHAFRHISDELWERPWVGREQAARWHLVLDVLVFGVVALVLLDRSVVGRYRSRLKAEE
ncbi:MAG: hypothetical protein ACTS3F_05985 [Phycisphaerales bacterium]